MSKINNLIEDHELGFLTAELLTSVPNVNVIDDKKLQEEILKLDAMIDSTSSLSDRYIDLCAAFRALMWIRNPEKFAPPSECVLP